MRRLAVVEFITLDGVMQGFGGPDEDREGGFAFGGWGAPYADEEIARTAGPSLGQTTAYLLGRKTYQAMAAHWPNEPAENQMAAHLNRTPKYVATRTLKRLDWSNSHVLEGDDLASAVNALKAEGEGFITVIGSGALVEHLNREGLIDDYRLFLHPLLLGAGKRLFRALDQPRRLRLESCAPTSTGVLMLHYAAVG